jgi:hypothetical protein
MNHDAAGLAEALPRRERTRNPARNESTLGDIARGWLIGVGVLLLGSWIIGLLLTGSAAHIAILYGAIVGIPVLTLYGVPVAIAAAAALLRVSAEWIHHAVFAGLGCAGGALTGLFLALTQGPGGAHLLVGASLVIGTTTAVLSRSASKAWAIRRWS